MSLSTTVVLEIAALILFVLAATGLSYKKVDLLAAGLGLFVLTFLIPELSHITFSMLVLALSVIAFAATGAGWRYRKLNGIAISLALWMVSLLLGPFFHIP